MTNILRAIQNYLDNSITNINEFYKSKNKINVVGDSFEAFIKDLFANTLNVDDERIKMDIYERTFSYSGNSNNPPDLMIIDGDAIEIKKIESDNAQIALNSSYPCAKLFADSPMITTKCRKCETWDEKDIIYTIGTVKNNHISLLWLVYGDCYAASREIYQRIKDTINIGVNSIPGVSFTNTKELGRVNKADPLSITHLRIRGMWIIEHPNKVFNYITPYTKDKNFKLFALMRETKYLSFPIEDRAKIEGGVNSNLSINSVKIKDPDNPVKQISAKLISYEF